MTQATNATIEKNIVQTAIIADAIKIILIDKGWTNFRASLENA
ncbi:hypothetical protein ACQUEW_11560 [Enterococcus casseliflavus]|jgi:hypothetical protein